jgi:hypothetical protein
MRLGFVFCDGGGGFSTTFEVNSVEDLDASGEETTGVKAGFRPLGMAAATLASGPLERLIVAGCLV